MLDDVMSVAIDKDFKIKITKYGPVTTWKLSREQFQRASKASAKNLCPSAIILIILLISSNFARRPTTFDGTFSRFKRFYMRECISVFFSKQFSLKISVSKHNWFQTYDFLKYTYFV